MDNPEYTFQILEVFAKIKTKEIPRELEEYISYVARTGDPVFQWSLVKILIKEKLLAVLNEFKENNPSLEIPPCPNVDSFNYEAMKNNLLSRLDSFILPPFTIQRICELLSAPRKEYSRIDKFMRAVEKNVLVVSACELSLKRGLEPENNDSMMNGMLYDKVNDSLNSFTNHVFSTTHESNVDELNLSGKVDVPENDTVQQILDETWTESGNGEVFKVSETNTSSLSVNFDNELHFASEKNSNNDKDEISDETESKNTVDNTSFNENDTLLVEPSLQNMIVENTDIHYDDEALKPTTSAESTSSEVNVACDKPEDNAVFNFNDNNSQMGNDISGQGEVSVTPESEKVSQLVKKSFDISSNEASGSKCQENNTEDDSKPCSSDHSFSENITNNESLESRNHLQNEQCKTEHSFEYDDFSQTSSKSDNSNEYNFIPDSSKNQDEDVTLEYSDNLSNVVDTKDDNDEIQKVTFPLSSLADDNLILTEATNATSHRVTDEVHLSPDKSNSNDEDNESLSCGDKESSSCSNTAECPKEPDLVPQVYGEPDPNNTGHE